MILYPEDEKEALEMYKGGIEYRKQASTNYNAHSSRSHLVFSIVVETKNNETGETNFGKISIVDLAGSEKLKHENKGIRKDEGIHVNRSLSALKNVIKKLKDKESHIPYRDSQLTMLMKDSLGGNSKTLVFINI